MKPVKMTDEALKTLLSLNAEDDYERHKNIRRMLYTDRTKTFAVSSFSAVMEIANKYAQINKIGDYDGQCVSFVKALCGFSTLTPNWKKGEQLSSTSPIQR